MPFDATDTTTIEYDLDDLANLKAARRLIGNPCQWIKFDYYSADYDKFCAHGAIRYTLKGEQGERKRQAFERLLKRLECQVPRTMTLVKFNDLSTTTHADILKLFDSAIAVLEEVRLADHRLR